LSVSRRQLLIGVSAAGLFAFAAPFAARFGWLPANTFSLTTEANAQGKPKKKFEIGDLYKPGPLGDHVIGKDDAPVTIVEYASFTCGHCASFHVNTFPKLKEKYIDAGKVRLIFRPFPTGPAELSIAAGMLSHCAGKEKYFAMASALFETQRNWMSSPDPVPMLQKLASQAGIDEAKFKQCLSDQTLAAEIQRTGLRGYETFGVEGTPTFFINGNTVIDGDASIDQFSKIIDPLIK
jgi:protein-disulfide isomerase